MLPRSLSTMQGLCNNTRLILFKAANILLHCKIASGDYAREEVLIPGMEIKQFIEWNRRQFPVRPSFAMTINKCQGLTLKKVGTWLAEHSFTHRKLYVEASWEIDPQHLHIAVDNSVSRKTRNVIYKEVL